MAGHLCKSQAPQASTGRRRPLNGSPALRSPANILSMGLKVCRAGRLALGSGPVNLVRWRGYASRALGMAANVRATPPAWAV